MAGENQTTLGAIADTVRPIMLSVLQEYQASLQPKPQPDSKATLEASAAPTSASAQMGQGFIEAIDSFNVPIINVKLPWASAVLGIGSGTIVSNAIDALIPHKNAAGQNNLVNPVLQLMAAGAEARFMPGNLGRFSAGAHIVKLALRYTPLADVMAKIEQMLAQPLAGAKTALTGQESFAQMPMYDHNMPAPAFTNAASPAWN